MSIQKFERSGKLVRPASNTSVINEGLEPHIYSIEESLGSFYLIDEQDKFALPEKIFNWNAEDYEYILHSIKMSSSNIGVILNGVKGTGKTLMLKRLCNELNMPVIKVDAMPTTDKTKEMMRWIDNSIKVSAIYVFDEFEKKFDQNAQKEMLSFFDGTSDATIKRVFLITSNQFNIDANFISRPGRIRYTLSFDNIKDSKMVIEYFNYELPGLEQEQLDWIVKYVKSKECCTFDIFSKIAEEIRLNGFNAFKEVGSKIFNAQDLGIEYHIEYITFNVLTDGERAFTDFCEATSKDIIARDNFSKKHQIEANLLRKKSNSFSESETIRINHDEVIKSIIESSITYSLRNMYCEPEDLEAGDEFELFGVEYSITEIKQIANYVYFSAVDSNAPANKIFCKVCGTYEGSRF